jgi:integrase/recombinase XerC
MRDAISTFLKTLRGLRAPRTITTYERILDEFADFVAARHQDVPNRADVEAFLARPRRDGAPRATSARNQALAAIRVLAEFAAREQLFDDPTLGVPFARQPRRDRAFLGVFQIRRLFHVAIEEARPRMQERDRALVALLSMAGLRVSELTGLDLQNVDLQSRLLVDVEGKGGTRRTIPLEDDTARIVAAWLAVRPRLAEVDEPALLVARHGRRMSVRSVQRLFEKWSRTMHVHAHPHLMRHSFITNGLALGGDVVSMQHLAGHQSLRSTQVYAHVVDPRRRDVVRRLAVSIPRELVPTIDLPGYVVEEATGPAPAASPEKLPIDFEAPFDDENAA